QRYNRFLSKHESFLMRSGSILLAFILATTVCSSSLIHAHGLSTDGDSPEAPATAPWLSFNDSADVMTEISSLRRTVRLLPNDPDYRLKLAGALLRVGDLDAAIEECRAAITLQPDDGHAHLQSWLMAKQDWHAAASALGEAIRLDRICHMPTTALVAYSIHLAM
ncbi:MAG: tetratricopeptide repeat protein, partial [Nitrospira sp.]